MFDYSSLINQVRRLLGDKKERYIETTESLQSSSYYIILNEEGTVTIAEDGVVINDVVVYDDMYSVDRNIIKFEDIVLAGSKVEVDYTVVKYSDEELKDYIGDTISSFIQPLMNTDFEFGVGAGVAESQTLKDINFNIVGLIVNGSVLNIIGIDLMELAGDAIYIRDNQTVINTAVGSKETMNNYKPVLEKFYSLYKTVRINTFSGEVI